MICDGDLVQFKELRRSTVNEFLMKLQDWIKRHTKKD